MSKAVLVMDMPDKCYECNFCDEDNTCLVMVSSIDTNVQSEKPDWCPLRELPEKKDERKALSWEHKKHIGGWNACINAITGNKETHKTMKEQEAIKSLKYLKEQLEDGSPDMFTYTGDDVKALETAISALEEIQQYRALGTVEELKVLKESALSGLELANIWAKLQKLKKYEAIGTVEELREAREKQRPKKPVEIRCAEYTHYRCECGYMFRTEYADGLKAGCIYHYCPDCGQAIDWSEENE